MVIVLLANGFEEIEALTPVDMLHRSGLTVKTVGISGRTPIGAHGIPVICDLLPEDVDLKSVDLLILPGGMPGTLNLDSAAFTNEAIKAVISSGGRIGAICAAPLILGRRGLLKGKRATCYPGFEHELLGAKITDSDVITDGKITTARGMGVACEFALELISLMVGKAKAKEINDAICRSDDFTVDEGKSDESLDPFAGYTPPSSELLNDDIPFEADTSEVKTIEARILSVFNQSGINVNIVASEVGIRVTRFILSANRRLSASRIEDLEIELALAIGLGPIRVVAPISDDNGIGIEVPNRKKGIVMLRGLTDSEEFKDSSPTSVCIGRRFDGEPIISDVSRMPHLLVSGATGMGKSVVISSILTSLLLKTTPDQLRLILIDPKQVEFTSFEGIPQLLCPIIHDPKRAAAALDWALKETDRRFEMLKRAGKFSVEYYNRMPCVQNGDDERLPYIVIVIDELAELMLMQREPTQELILRIAQRSRAAGIHLIIGTQRPSPDVITDLIKANIPSRICCKVSSVNDSETVLDMGGAEKLLGSGDALYSIPGCTKPQRVQCVYVSEEEIKRITDTAKTIGSGIGYDRSIDLHIDNYLLKLKYSSVIDDDFLAAVDIAIETRKISTSLIQRRLTIGYAKAARYIDIMEELGIVTPMNGQRPRDVIMTREEWIAKLAMLR